MEKLVFLKHDRKTRMYFLVLVLLFWQLLATTPWVLLCQCLEVNYACRSPTILCFVPKCFYLIYLRYWKFGYCLWLVRDLWTLEMKNFYAFWHLAWNWDICGKRGYSGQVVVQGEEKTNCSWNMAAMLSYK